MMSSRSTRKPSRSLTARAACLNDLFGGSPYNAACRLVIANEAYGIVTGVNLPMLIEMCSAQIMDEGLSIQELMDKAAEAGKSGMQFFHASQIAADDDDEDDDLL